MAGEITKDMILEDYRQSGESIRTVAGRHNIDESTLRRWIKKSRHIKPDFCNPPHRKVDPIKFLHHADQRVGKHQFDQDYTQIRIKTDRPIAIMKVADIHFGGLDVDYSSLLAHTEFLFNNPHFYIQLFGDDVNLMVMHTMAAARHDGWTPEEQVAWIESFVDECLRRGKIISMASGNHSDEFTERNAGFGIVRAIMKHKVPYFRGLGYIDLKVGRYTYPMAFVHKTRFNSFMNPTHGNKRMAQLHSHFFGVNRKIAREYITAHTHNPAISMEGCLPEERIYYIKCGTFKTNCVHSQRFFGQGRIGVPTVVYHPDRFEHVCFPTPWEAYRYMTGRDWKKS
ncbi:MAG: transposase [Sedimentisphaerales bacterium]|nr:transposase [Sedimentisphaerales bacterium]